MINEESFYEWLKGADLVFESLEGRYDVYNICQNWINELLGSSNNKFTIEEKDRNIISEVPEGLLLYTKDENVRSAIKDGYKDLIERKLEKHTDKLSFAVSFYLMTWNIRRFEKYFLKKPDLDLEKYFLDLESDLQYILKNYAGLRRSYIYREEIDGKSTKELFERLGDALKRASPVDENEPVGTIKIMHILFPYYIPLLDNPIAKALKKANLVNFEYRQYSKGIIIDSDSFIEYIHWIKHLLEPFKKKVEQLEKETNKSILKLIDEAFYIRYSIDVLRRLKND